MPLGFDASEISANYNIVYVRSKQTSDTYATIDYSQFILTDMFSSPNYILYLCGIQDSQSQGWGSTTGKVTWTAKSGKKVMKVVVESNNENIADRIGFTSSDTGATTTVNGALTTCTFSGNGVDSFVVGCSASASTPPLIKKITVTYQ